MKVAIITNTCYEEIIPLAKHMSGTIEIDLIATVSQSGAWKQLLFEKDDLWEREKCGLILNVDKKQYIADEFSICAGNPAKKIRQFESLDQIQHYFRSKQPLST